MRFDSQLVGWKKIYPEAEEEDPWTSDRGC